MRLFAKFAHLFGWHETDQPRHMVEQIREEMLATLRVQCDHKYIDLDRTLRFARELDDLWYLRSDLLQAITRCKGDATAYEDLQRITSMFPWKETTSASSRFNSR